MKCSPPESGSEWRIHVNAEYQKVISLITGLATAAFVLPLFFIRDISGVKDGEALWPHLSCTAYASWVFLSIAIASGILYHYVSAKWIKKCFRGETCLTFKALEKWLDGFFWSAGISFIAGLLFLAAFALTLQSVA